MHDNCLLIRPRDLGGSWGVVSISFVDRSCCLYESLVSVEFSEVLRVLIFFVSIEWIVVWSLKCAAIADVSFSNRDKKKK